MGMRMQNKFNRGVNVKGSNSSKGQEQKLRKRMSNGYLLTDSFQKGQNGAIPLNACYV